MTKDEKMQALVAEAKRQRVARLTSRSDRLLARLGWMDGWFVLKGEIARRRPFRWVWRLRCAWLLHWKWNYSVGHPDHNTVWDNLVYSGALVEMLDEPGEGYLSPSDAIDSDRQYWEG